MKLPVTVIILTKDEEVHLASCLESIKDWTDEILIVDSFSSDGTEKIAARYGAKFFQHPFENQAQQFNWALAELSVSNPWVLRLDADERMTRDLWEEIAIVLPRIKGNICGFLMKRRVYFMGRWIRHGGYYPTWFLRLFRYGLAKSEEREVDEHLVLLEGRTQKLKNDFIDENKRNLYWWTEKHNQYADREIQAIIRRPISQKRNLDFYYRWPVFFRAFAYFFYRYFFRLGFLDGQEGLVFHFLQGCWYRFLVDAKLMEYKRGITGKK